MVPFISGGSLEPEVRDGGNDSVALSVLGDLDVHTHVVYRHESGDSLVTLLCIGRDAQPRGIADSLDGAALEAEVLNVCFSIHLGSEEACCKHAGQSVFSFQRPEWVRGMLECADGWASLGGHPSAHSSMRTARVHIITGGAWDNIHLPFLTELSHSAIRRPDVVVFTRLVGVKDDAFRPPPVYSSTRWRIALTSHSPGRGHDNDTSLEEEDLEAEAFPEWVVDSSSEHIAAVTEIGVDPQDFDFDFPEWESDSSDSESPCMKESTSLEPSPQEHAQQEVCKMLASPLVASIGLAEHHVDKGVRAQQGAQASGEPADGDVLEQCLADIDGREPLGSPAIRWTAAMALAMTALGTPSGDDRTPMRDLARRQLVAHMHGVDLPDTDTWQPLPGLGYDVAAVAQATPPDMESDDESDELGYVHPTLHRSSGTAPMGARLPLLVKDVAFRRSGGELGQQHTIRRIRHVLYDTGASLNVVDERTVRKWQRQGHTGVVSWHSPQALPISRLGVVGGGSVTTVGGCTVSLLFRDQEEHEWRSLEVTFVVIRGPRTIARARRALFDALREH